MNKCKKLLYMLMFITTFNLSLYASCLPAHEDAFIVNEINTHGNWIELYANPDNIQSPVSNWQATVCTTDKCETLTFSFDIATNPDGFFYVIDFDALFGGNDWNGKSLDVRIQDDAGNEVNYFNLGLKQGNTNTSLSVPAEVTACGIYDTSCDYFYRTNSSESNFYRDPDGGCGLNEVRHGINTESGSNNPDPFRPINLSISDVSLQEGDSGSTQFVFDITVDPNLPFGLTLPYWQDIYIVYSTQDNTATVADSDYISVINSVAVLPALNTSVSITIDVVGDLNVELDETFFLNLNATTIGSFSDNQGVGTIVNDDGGGPAPSPGVYNAIDFNGVCNAQTNWNDNIKTKIVNETFDFSILAKDDTTDLPLEANITKVTLKYYPDGDNSVCSGVSNPAEDEEVCTNCGVTDVDGCLGLSVPIVQNNKASKCVEVVIEGKDKDDTAETTLSTSSATDNFSIRPDHYSLVINPDTLSAPFYYAGEGFSIDGSALNSDGTTTVSYYENQSLGSFIIEGNETRSDCMTGVESLTVDPAVFDTGLIKPSLNASFSGLAEDLNIKIHEVVGSEFALVDSDDTPDENMRLITPYDINITIKPYEINVTQTNINASSGLDWLYMADLNDMNVTLFTQVQANNKQHEALTDFNATCYAEDVNVTFGVSTDGDGLLDMNYSAVHGTFNDGTLVKNAKLQDINQTMTIKANSFIDGVGEMSMAFNIDRDFTDPIAPFDLSGLSAEIVTLPNVKVTTDDSSLDDGNISLYYGRLFAATPKEATSLPTTHTLKVQYYTETGGWSTNTLHNGNLLGEAFDAVASSSLLMENELTGFSRTINPVVSGEQNIDILVVPDNHFFIHLKTQKWLWYIPSLDYGSDYDDGPFSDASTHPYFEFILSSNDSVLKIESGDFNGTVIPDVNRTKPDTGGVKLFR